MPKVIRVDMPVVPSDGIIQWAYEDHSRELEFVEYAPISENVRICDSSLNEVEIYSEDIPKLIIALQAAHKHITNS